MTDGVEIPVSVIWKLQRKLNKAIDARLWDEVAGLANAVSAQLKLAINPATSHTGGTPHLDGVYSVGTMHYDRAPKTAKAALHKMNRIIKTAKRTLR